MELTEIKFNTIVTQTAGIVVADMDGEKAMLNIAKGKYYGLDSIGSRIWEILEIPHTVEEVVSALINEYDVLEKTCQQDVTDYLLTLHGEGLVEFA